MPNQVLRVEPPTYIDGKAVKSILINTKTGTLVFNWQYRTSPVGGANSVPLQEFVRAVEAFHGLPPDLDAFVELLCDPKEGDPTSYRRAIVSHLGIKFGFWSAPELFWLGLTAGKRD